MKRARFPLLVVPVALLTLTGCVSVPRLDDILASAARAPQTTRILAADGSLITTLHAEIDRSVVPLREIPADVRNAVVAIEDARFYRHAGIDYVGIARALARDASAGRAAEGGSTITQQLVKNLLLDREKTVRRKIHEAVLARQIEERLSKDEILERYLNTVYFGRGAYGIETAAHAYFSKPASALTLPEGALLAGLIRAPSRYDPATDPASAITRRNLVLARMTATGQLPAARLVRARRAPLGVRVRTDGARYPDAYFVEYVKDLIMDGDREFKALGTTRAERINALFRGGLRIETTLDPRLQESAERAAALTLHDPTDPSAAFVGMRPDDGAIVAMVGGRDFFDDRSPFAKFNLAVQSRRQPGSAFKLFALIAAIEKGIPLDRTYRAGPSISLPGPGGKPWVVRNYEGTSFGPRLSLKRATALSVNVVYAQLVRQTGAQAVVDVARRMGITSPLRAYDSIALGAQEVNPLELATAYATLASGGYRVRALPIRRITDARGRVLYRARAARVRVLSPAVVASATDALVEVMRSGTGKHLQLGFPAAGKTGTSDEYHDAWFAGFTPRMVGVSWVGFPRAQIPMLPPRTRIRVYGSSWPGVIWRAFMLEARKGLPALDFPAPSDVMVRVAIDRLRDCLPNANTPRFAIEIKSFMRGDEPTSKCADPASGMIESVPDVLGKGGDAAVRALMLAGIDARVASRYCPSYRPGTVCAQEPPPGARARVGAPGTVFVSDDAAVSQVPLVLGSGLSRARATLRNAGYDVRVVTEANNGASTGCRDPGTRTRGTVWQQDPCGGANYGRGAVVTVRVNP